MREDDTPAQLSITAPLTSGNAENLIPKGDIVLGDMFKLYRYENWFYQITMSGKEVRTWLEYSASRFRSVTMAPSTSRAASPTTMSSTAKASPMSLTRLSPRAPGLSP